VLNGLQVRFRAPQNLKRRWAQHLADLATKPGEKCRLGIHGLEHRLERQAERARCGRLRVADPDHDHGHSLRECRHNLSSGILDSLTLLDKVAFVDQVYGVKLADVIELNADSSDTLQQLVDAISG
jgi:hypothetical protein